MLQKRIAEKIDEGLRQLKADQEDGNAPPPGKITRAELARRSGVSEATIYKIEMIALAKAYAYILQDKHFMSHFKLKP